jgi:hypothetical protein
MWCPVDDDGPERGTRTPYALFDKELLLDLAQAMPDAQSAVLLCLAWQAARQARLHHASNAGQSVARLSGPQLAQLTGRPLRTIRHALRSLKQVGRVDAVSSDPGQTTTYRLNLGCGMCED